MSKMEELFEKADIKGITHWQVYQILHRNGWEIWVYNPIPGFEWGNRERKRLNAKAIEDSLIEIDYLV